MMTLVNPKVKKELNGLDADVDELYSRVQALEDVVAELKRQLSECGKKK